MPKLDVEQQLRLHMEREKDGQAASMRRTTSERFLTTDSFALISQPATVVAGSVVLLSAVLLTLTLAHCCLRSRFQSGIKRARADLFASYFAAPAYAIFMASWLVLVAADTISRMMEAVSSPEAMVRSGPPISIMCPGELSLQLGLFALECAGVVGVWLYVLDRSPYTMEMGGAVALLVFFPSLYRSLAVDNEAPDRSAVWTTHGVFLTSLFVVYATAAPWLRREVNVIMYELQNHTANAIYRDRPQPSQLSKKQ